MKKIIMLGLCFCLTTGVAKADIIADIIAGVGVLEQKLNRLTTTVNQNINFDNSQSQEIANLKARVARLEQRRKRQAIQELGK